MGLGTPLRVLTDLKGAECALWKKLGVVEPPAAAGPAAGRH